MSRLFGLACIFYMFTSQASVLVKNAQIRLLPPGVPNTSIYFEIENTNEQPLVLLGGSTTIADSVEIHRHIMTDDSMRMERQNELVVASGKTVTFAPGGLHLMVFGLHQPLVEGQFVPVSLITKSGEIVPFDAKVTRP